MNRIINKRVAAVIISAMVSMSTLGANVTVFAADATDDQNVEQTVDQTTIQQPAGDTTTVDDTNTNTNANTDNANINADTNQNVDSANVKTTDTLPAAADTIKGGTTDSANGGTTSEDNADAALTGTGDESGTDNLAVASTMAIAAPLDAASGSIDVAATADTSTSTDEGENGEVYTPEETDDGISYDFNWDNLNSEGYFNLNIVIGENAEGKQSIDIGNMMIECLNEYAREATKNYKNPWENYIWMPGDTNSFNITITTADGLKHTYVYNYSNSYGESSVSDEIFNTVEFDEHNETGITGFDGKDIPINYVGKLTSCDAICELCGITPVITYRNGKYECNYPTVSAEKLTNINSYLLKMGYEGDDALTNYLLDYYNNKCGTNATNLNDLPTEAKKAITGGKAVVKKDDRSLVIPFGTPHNGIYSVSGVTLGKIQEIYGDNIRVTNIKDNPDGTIKSCNVQFIPSDNKVAAMSYDWFYFECLSLTFGDDEEKISAYLGNYMNNTNGIRDEFENYVNNKISLEGLTGGSDEVNLSALIALSGPNTGNAYMNYPFGFDAVIALKQLDGSVSLTKVDSNGNVIAKDDGSDADEATFNLYYVDKDSDTGVDTYYYLLDAANATFTTDSSSAAKLTTVNGNLSVNYLLPNIYYFQEISAPNGYALNANVLKVEVKSGMVANVKFVDESDVPTPGPDPTPDPDPTPNPDPTPETTTDTPTVTPLVLGATRTVAEAPIDQPEVLGASRTIEDEPAVLGASRNGQTGDMTSEAGRMGILIACAGAVAALLVGKKKKNIIK